MNDCFSAGTLALLPSGKDAAQISRVVHPHLHEPLCNSDQCTHRRACYGCVWYTVWRASRERGRHYASRQRHLGRAPRHSKGTVVTSVHPWQAEGYLPVIQ